MPRYKQVQFKADSYDAEQGIFDGYASVFGVLDSEGDIVQPGAFRRTLAEGAAMGGVRILLQHNDKALPIGKSLELREDERGLYIKGIISETSSGRDVRQLVKDGVLADMSIGYMPVIEDTDPNGVRNLRDVELLEISIVTFPANPQARIQGYKHKPPSGQKQRGGKTMGFKDMSPEEQQDFLHQVAAEAAEEAIEEALKSAADEDDEEEKNDDPSDEEKNDDEDEEKNSDEDEEKRKSRASGSRRGKSGMFERTARNSVKGAKAARRTSDYASLFIPQNGRSGEKKSTMPPGIGFVRSIKCMNIAQGDPDRAASIARKSYGDETLTREIKALTATSPVEGGYLIPEAYAAEVIPLLYAKAVITKLGATVMPMETGTLNIPKMTAGASAGYTGEMRKGKNTGQEFGNIRMSGKKLVTKIPISNDLLRANTYQADNIILNDALTAMALAMDRAGFIGSGSEFEPRGLFKMSGVKRLSMDKLDESTTGLMMGELIKKNVDTNKLGWAFNGNVWTGLYNVTNAMGLYIYRQQMDEGKLNGHEYGVTNQLPVSNGVTQLVLGNWADFIVGMQLEMQAEFFREGSITDNEGGIISAIDNDATILRVMSIHDFAVRHEESFVITNLKTE